MVDCWKCDKLLSCVIRCQKENKTQKEICSYNKTKVERDDRDKVPDDFPKMKTRSRLWSQGGKPYLPYYSAKEVWKWFKENG